MSAYTEKWLSCNAHQVTESAARNVVYVCARASVRGQMQMH